MGTISMGHEAPEIVGLRTAGSENGHKVILDIHLHLQGANIGLDLKMGGVKMTSGLQDIDIDGIFRVILAPIVSDAPFIGGVTIGFAEKPECNSTIKAIGMGLMVDEWLNNLLEDVIMGNFCW